MSIDVTQIAQIGVSSLNAAFDWLADFAAHEASNVRTGLARRNVYRAQYCALQSQSDAELAKSGVARGNIQAMAIRFAMDADIH